MHKGFKCLDILMGRIYISRDVVFDENVFPFSELHDNAGARLQAEGELLSANLLGSSWGTTSHANMTNDLHPPSNNVGDTAGIDFGENPDLNPISEGDFMGE